MGDGKDKQGALSGHGEIVNFPFVALISKRIPFPKYLKYTYILTYALSTPHLPYQMYCKPSSLLTGTRVGVFSLVRILPWMV